VAAPVSGFVSGKKGEAAAKVTSNCRGSKRTTLRPPGGPNQLSLLRDVSPQELEFRPKLDFVFQEFKFQEFKFVKLAAFSRSSSPRAKCRQPRVT
jgi:hypothetical protein